MNLKMSILEERFAVCKIKSTAKIPSCILNKKFVSITRTDDELSIVLDELLLSDYIDEIGKAEVYKGFRALKVEGPLDFSLIGILSSIAGTLAEVKVSIFAISTFDTDYILLQDESLEIAISALKKIGIDI